MIEYTVKVYDNGDIYWYMNGVRHREDGPAIEYSNGNKLWYLNDKLHREDDTAVEWCDGDKEWFLNGKLHREDGPAVEYSDGDREWYLNEEEFTEEEFLQMTQKHVVIIDGQEIKISEESYKELQKSLK